MWQSFISYKHVYIILHTIFEVCSMIEQINSTTYESGTGLKLRPIHLDTASPCLTVVHRSHSAAIHHSWKIENFPQSGYNVEVGLTLVLTDANHIIQFVEVTCSLHSYEQVNI